MSNIVDAVLAALRKFAYAVTAKMNAATPGDPEEQLRGPFDTFMQEVGKAHFNRIICTGNTKLANRLGKPDFAVHVGKRKLLAGYVELKATGTGANPKRFKKGHNRDQWERFKAIPNLIYTDGNDWGLYRRGEAAGQVVRLTGDVTTDGNKAVSREDAQRLWGLLADFLTWKPEDILPKKAKDLAGLLAPLCRMLRDDVTDALKDEASPLSKLADQWRKLLFPDANDEQFADGYAQTVTFALLLAKGEGAELLAASETAPDPTKAALVAAADALAVDHALLSRALDVLTNPVVREEISASLEVLLRVIDEVPEKLLKGADEDPWLFFYEDFLAAYDPKLRKNAGAYYTPVEVVRAQVRLIDDLLTNRLGKPLGFADDGVVTLDPAAGTGTYLLGVIEHAMDKIKEREGEGAQKDHVSGLAGNLYGFEIMVGPYAVTELRVNQALARNAGGAPVGWDQMYLTDTLESPHVEPPQAIMGFAQQAFADQHRKAARVKAEVPVIVCLGNPPYDRHAAVDATERRLSRFGGWVRFGDALAEGTVKGDGKSKRGAVVELTPEERLHRREKQSILQAFIAPTVNAGYGVHVKNLYNLYVYFWRWALWKVFESRATAGPGVVSFISASSYIDGDAFCGMREHMRRVCDEIWILDLGGQGRGSRKTENVFAIQTPVAIAIALRHGPSEKSAPAKVYYAPIAERTRKDKLEALQGIRGFASLPWEECPDHWHAAFRPQGKGAYSTWPMFTQMLPWQHSGAQFKRTWPIAPLEHTLQDRWRALLSSCDKRSAFRETRDRTIDRAYPALPDSQPGEPIAALHDDASVPPIHRYAFRSFDRQWVLADNRLGDFIRPDLWAVHGKRQVYLTTQLSEPLGKGPALTGVSCIPDLHHFAGRGARDTVPLHRDRKGVEGNVHPQLLPMLKATFGYSVTHEDLFAYIYGALAHAAFTARWYKELESRELRVPLTKDAGLFVQVRDVGANLLWLHTYGQRYVPEDKTAGDIPVGAARCTKGVTSDGAGYPEGFEYNESTRTLHVGAGQFAPVSPEVYDFEVSGLKVVHSWLGYRMKDPKGKKSSPLDEINPTEWPTEFTMELLQLLWVLEATLAEYPKQAELLDQVVEGECFTADELPDVPDYMRKPPKRDKGLFGEE